MAVGRKNWQFAGSRFGDKAAAAWFSLIGSAKLHEVEPWAYLTDVTTRLAHLGDAPSVEDLMPLLPDRWIAANPQARLPVSREPREQPVDGSERRRRFSNAYGSSSTLRGAPRRSPARRRR